MRAFGLVPLLSLAVSAIACQGNVKTTALPPDAMKVGDTQPGVIFFFPQLVKATYSFTAITDNTGKVVGTADNNGCRAVLQKEELSVMPDFSRPMLLQNNSKGTFAKFAVTLSNGMLASVNSEPTQTAASILSSGATLLKASTAGALVLAPGTPTVACNAEPRITRVSRALITD